MKARILLWIALVVPLVISPIDLIAASKKQESSEGYTINFDNVPIKEFLKFISKIAGLNVIYNESDLDFNVTIVSQEPTDLSNVLSALVQVLRIHGLTLIEEEKNLIIHKNDGVRQIPTVVSKENPLKGSSKPAIMTKVFKIQKGNPSNIASLIIPMLSKEALVEVSMETRQLIITDISSSIQTIEELLLSLDAPETPYDVDSFKATNSKVIELAALAKQILAPMAEATTLEIIPQPATQKIYIVSTPFLIDKALVILRDLDNQGVSGQISALHGENVLVYKLLHKSPEEIESELKKVLQESKSQGLSAGNLPNVLASMKYIKSTNSLMFVGSPQDLAIIASFLRTLDGGGVSTNVTFYLFESKQLSLSSTLKAIQEISDHLEKSHYANPALITALKQAQAIVPISAILFTGDPETIKELQSLLASVEASYTNELLLESNTKFLIYSIKHANEEQIRASLHNLADYLEKSLEPHENLIQTIDSMQWLKSTNSLLFIGPAAVLQELSELLPSFDVSPEKSKALLTQASPSTEFLTYSPKQVTALRLKELVNETTNNLKSADLSDPMFIKTLESVRILPSSNQLIFTGDKASLARLTPLLTTLSGSTNDSHVVFVHVHARAAKDIVDILHETADKLPPGVNANSGLAQTLKNSQWMANSNTVILSGSAEDITLARELIASNDIPIQKSSGGQGPYLIHLTYADFDKVKSALNQLAIDLPKNDPIREMIRTMNYLPDSNVLVFKGPETALHRIQEVINLTDTLTTASGKEVVFIPISHRSSKDIIKILHDAAQALAKNGSPNTDLIQTLKTADTTANGNTVILSGTPPSIQKATELISANDTQQNPSNLAEVFVYKPRYLDPANLQMTLRGIAEHANNNNPNEETSALVKAIDTMRTIPDSNAVQFIATHPVIIKIKEILSTLDTSEHAKSNVQPQLGTNFLVYKIKYVKAQDLLNNLKQIVKSSSSPDSILKSIAGASYASASNSLVFTGDKTDLDKIQTLLETLDQGQAPPKISPSRQAEGYKTYKPQYVSGGELINMIKNFEQHLLASGIANQNLSEVIDHLSYVERTNTIIITGNETDINRVLELLKEFDTQEAASGKLGGKSLESGIETIDDTGFLIYKLQHQSGSGIVGALSVISRDLGSQTIVKKNESLIEAIRSTQWIEPTNSLIATGQPRILTKLRELIESIDQPLKQVFIEVLVLETNNTYDLEFGLRWGSQGAVHNRFAWGSGNYSPLDSSSSGNNAGAFPTNFNQISGTRIPTGSDIPPIEGGLFGVIGDIIWHHGKSYSALGSLLNAIRSDGNITVVLSQKIVAQDNQNAKIFSGSNIPFTGSLVTTSGLSQTTNANLEYRNVGVTLSITPIIGDNDTITLDIDQEISEVANQGSSGSSTTTQSTNSVNGIQTTKTSMQTRVHMPDRHFLILSGTMRNQFTRNVSGIPCLGGLPLVGAAFSQSTRQTSTTNVIIFVKPQIIKSPQAYAQITKTQEELFGSKEQANVDDFQKGIEAVRSPDDTDYETE